MYRITEYNGGKMIISASRRTDIPAFYTKWFMKRIEAKELLIRNPIYYHQVSQIDLSPEVIDCIIFWTRNAKPLIPYLDTLDNLGYKYYFQYTITAYSQQWEKNNPPIEQKLDTFIELSQKLGKEKVIWRYDPIFLNNKELSINYHIESFEKIANKLYKYTDKCVTSFLDTYKKIEKKLKEFQIYSPLANEKELDTLLATISTIASKYNLSITTCSEEKNLSKYNISIGKCIDTELIEKITNKKFKNPKKDPNQRECCGCITSIDIGAYNTCLHGCQYCYATYNTEQTKNNYLEHNPSSALLCGNIMEKDKISIKTMKVLLEENYANSLF